MRPPTWGVCGKYGKIFSGFYNILFSASEGIGEKSGKMKRSKLSKRASTRWDELLTVR